jgi:uncharacterized protein DUF3108
MKRRTRFIALTVAVLVCAVAVAVRHVRRYGTVAPPPTNTTTLPNVPQSSQPPLPFLPGETAGYELRGPGGVMAQCELTNARSEAGELIVAYKATAVGGLAALRPFDLGGNAVVDLQTLRPISAEKWSNKRGREGKRTVTQFDTELTKARVIKHRPYKEEEEKRLREEEIALDGHMDLMSVLTILRARRPALDQPVEFALVSGDDYREMVVEKLGDAPLELPIGKYNATQLMLRIRKLPDSPDEEPGPWRGAAVWVASDTWLPLRFDASMLVPGATADLVRYEPGAGEW